MTSIRLLVNQYVCIVLYCKWNYTRFIVNRVTTTCSLIYASQLVFYYLSVNKYIIQSSQDSKHIWTISTSYDPSFHKYEFCFWCCAKNRKQEFQHIWSAGTNSTPNIPLISTSFFIPLFCILSSDILFNSALQNERTRRSNVLPC